MAQEHQEGNSVDPATQSMRRKRGRPRKDDIHGSEPYRTRRRNVNVETHENDPFVGQVISGVLDGKFDAGYMLTVRIGEEGSVLRGVVFEPGLSVPISPANDIAPNVKMFKRDEVSIPSAQQLHRFTPIRSRKDGSVRYPQRNEFTVSSKDTCTDTIMEGMNAEVQTHSSVDIQKLPENESNHASGNLKQDLQSGIVDHASKDGICNMQSFNAGAECSGNIHTPEIGNPSITELGCAKTVNLPESFGEDKPIIQQSQAVSESKQPAMSVGKLGFASDNSTTNHREAVSEVKLDTQMCQHTCEAKQTGETFRAGRVSMNDKKTAYSHEVDNDANPVSELSRIKTSESKQPAETSNAAPVFMIGAPDDCCKVLPPVAVQISEQITASVTDANPLMEVSQTKASESEQSAEASRSGAVSKNGASDNYCKTLSPATVQIAGQPNKKMADAEPVTEAPETTTSVHETSETGPVVKNGASDEYGKVLPPLTIQTSVQIIGGTGLKPVSEVSQTKISVSKPSSETSDAEPVFTYGASDDYVKVLPPEHLTGAADDLCVVPQTMELPVNEPASQHVKPALEGGTVQVRMSSSGGQEPRVHLEPLESDKPVELPSGLLMINLLPSEVIPEELQCDRASPSGASNESVLYRNR